MITTSILNSILPDNDNFDIDDAERWEERLGMISNSSDYLCRGVNTTIHIIQGLTKFPILSLHK